MEGYNSTSLPSLSALVTTTNESQHQSDLMNQSLIVDVLNVASMLAVLKLMTTVLDWATLIDGFSLESKKTQMFVTLLTPTVIAFLCQFLALPIGYYLRAADGWCEQYWKVALVLNRGLHVHSLLHLLLKPLFLLQERFVTPCLHSIFGILAILVIVYDFMIVIGLLGLAPMKFDVSSYGCELSTDRFRNVPLAGEWGHVIRNLVIQAQPIIFILSLIYPFLYLTIRYRVKISTFIQREGRATFIFAILLLMCLFFTFACNSLMSPLSMVWDFKTKHLVTSLVSFSNLNEFIHLSLIFLIQQPYEQLLDAIENYIISVQISETP